MFDQFSNNLNLEKQVVQLGFEDPREKAAAGQLNKDLTEEDELYSFIKQT